ncbi:unnamed protein product [Sphagnum balticum]
MRDFNHELGEEIHPGLQVDVALGELGSGEVVEAGVEGGAYLADAVVPFEDVDFPVLLRAEEPFVPPLHLLPVLRPESDGVEPLLPPQIVQGQDEGGRVAVADVLFHEGRAAA